ncbi:MAG: xanthine dehydrogenase family protein molybdopterin-binding subunit [Pseudomonadota bacterium]
MPIVGTNIPRLDAADKVTGRALYVDDVAMLGMWHGAVVRTTIPHGRIVKVELDPSFDWSQVVVADAKDITGKNCVAMVEDDLPLIVTDVVKHIGEAILLIAAPTRELALEARTHVKATYEELTPVLSIEDAKLARIKIRGDDNVIARHTITKGDIEKGFEAADRMVEGTYTMGHQEHMYIEPQGMIAAPREGGGFTIIGSMQCPYYISRAMMVLLGLPEESFAIRQACVGGAFGGKEDYPSILAGYCVLLAKKCGRPVKIVYDRAEDTEVTTKRHPAIVHHRTGVARDGAITAMDIRIEMDGGAYATLTPVVLSRGSIHSVGPYRCDNVLIHAAAYATNTPPNGAFRGFGVPQTAFPLEVHIDRVAGAIGMSPLEFRRKNCLRIGDRTATGQIMKESVGSEAVLEEASRRSDFERRRSEFAAGDRGSKRRGIGMSFFFHGAAFTGSAEAVMKGKAGLRLDPDGRITVLTACTEMGQGAHTVLPQMAADHLGVDISCIGIETPDTSLVPNSGPTVASRTTMVMGVVLGKCAGTLKSKLFAYAADKFSVDPKKISFKGDSIFGDGRKLADVADVVKGYLDEVGPLAVIDHYELPPGIVWDETSYKGDAYPAFSWGCDVAEVEVDMETFEVRIVKMWLAQEIGKAINPKLVEGQIEGGTLQSVGWATMERHELDGGRFRTNRFQTYLIPTALDAPEMESAIVEEPYPHGPMGAKGVGELPMDGGAPAIANAVAHATGLLISDLPITPERLYEAWKKEGKK